MLIVRSPVRISFGGGGTDLPAYYERYGGAVISAAINKYFYTVLRKRNDGLIQVISSDLRACETWQNIARMDLGGTDLEIPLAVLKQVGCDISVDLFLSSEIPPGTGLGSSAAVCVNVLKTITTYLHRSCSSYELAEQAYDIARNVLGKHVGKQDEYASAIGGLNFLRFERDGRVEVEALNLDPRILSRLQSNLMLFFTGTAHHSWTILRDQEKASSKPAGKAVEALHEIRGLADRMRDVLMAGDLRAFGLLLDEGWQAKKRVSEGISNARIDELYASARQNGALGGKITGAGGGGFLLLYCETPDQQRVREAFRAFGIREMAFDFDFQGAQVIANDPFIDGDERCGTTWTFIPNSPGLSVTLQ
jgi:D-glycero-alpha-D-manno-heptose-7-phosphate kinase